MEQLEQSNDFEAVKARLEEIANAVDDESLSLDEALDLYEEAVKLGLQASNLLETGIVIEDEPEPEAPASTGASTDASADASTSASADAGASAGASEASTSADASVLD